MEVNPPEYVFTPGDTFESLLTDIGYAVPDRTNDDGGYNA
jgi:hypothetical protein